MDFFSKAPTILLIHEEPTSVGFDKACDVLLSPCQRRSYMKKFGREPPPKVLSVVAQPGTNCLLCTLYERAFVVRLAGHRVFRQNVPVRFANNEIVTCGDDFYKENFRACYTLPTPSSAERMDTLFPHILTGGNGRGQPSSGFAFFMTTPTYTKSSDELLGSPTVCAQLPPLLAPRKNLVKDSASSVVFDPKSSESTPRSESCGVNRGAIPATNAKSPQVQEANHSTGASYSKSALRISPYVLERRGTHPFLRPLVLFPNPSYKCAPNVSTSVCGSSAAFAAGYITANGQQILQEQVNGDEREPFALAAAKKVVEQLQTQFNAHKNEFSPFAPEEKVQFFSLFKSVATQLLQRLQCTPVVLHLSSPLMCCGDIHGSFCDLQTILEQSAPFGHWSLLYSPLLFLGDFVDRGPHSVEVVLILFSWALLCPDKVYLVRGNHEDPSVNGNSDFYGERSFIAQARAFFGDADGFDFWQLTNLVFSYLPVAVVVDDTIFACHGGIPLLAKSTSPGMPPPSGVLASSADHATDANVDVSIPTEALFEDLLMKADVGPYCFQTVLKTDSDDPLTAMRRRLIRELLWNDPAAHGSAQPRQACPESKSSSSACDAVDTSLQFDACGFRCNRCRKDASGDVREFSESALTYFLERFGFSLLLRAHQQKSMGVEVVERKRIITLFSCCDYAYCCKNCAGACLICGGFIRLISWHPEQRSTLGSRFSQRLFGNGSKAPSLDVQQLAQGDQRLTSHMQSSAVDSSTREIRAAEARFRQRPVTEIREYG